MQQHITKLLTPLKTLRALRLNLDFPDTTGPRTSLKQYGEPMRHTRWIAAAQMRGLEMADVMEAHCPELECVCLLVHDASGSYWWKFRPSKWPGGRVDHERSEAETCVHVLMLLCLKTV